MKDSQTFVKTVICKELVTIKACSIWHSILKGKVFDEFNTSSIQDLVKMYLQDVYYLEIEIVYFKK